MIELRSRAWTLQEKLGSEVGVGGSCGAGDGDNEASSVVSEWWGEASSEVKYFPGD